jgi:hypothetical protein
MNSTFSVISPTSCLVTFGTSNRGTLFLNRSKFGTAFNEKPRVDSLFPCMIPKPEKIYQINT